MDIDQERIEIMVKSIEATTTALRVDTEKSHITRWLEETFASEGGFERFCEVLELSPGWGRRKWDQVGGYRSSIYIHEVSAISKALDLDFIETLSSAFFAYEEDLRAHGRLVG